MPEKEKKPAEKKKEVPESTQEKIDLISSLASKYDKKLGSFFDEQVVKSRAERLKTYQDLGRGDSKFRPKRLVLAEKILDIGELNDEVIRKYSPEVGGYFIHTPFGLRYLSNKLFHNRYAEVK